jgi:hypothetical protein
MKKLLLLIAIVTASMQLFAQHSVGTFTLQPKAGVNISSMQKGGGAKIGFVGGLEGEYQLTDMVSMSAGVIYSQQGEKNPFITIPPGTKHISMIISMCLSWQMYMF